MTARQSTLCTVPSSDADFRWVRLCLCPPFNCFLLWKFALIASHGSFASFNCFLLDHSFSTVPLLTFQIRSFSSYPGHRGCQPYAIEESASLPFYLLDTRRCPLAVAIENLSRYCQVSQGRLAKSSLVENHCSKTLLVPILCTILDYFIYTCIDWYVF